METATDVPNACKQPELGVCLCSSGQDPTSLPGEGAGRTAPAAGNPKYLIHHMNFASRALLNFLKKHPNQCVCACINILLILLIIFYYFMVSISFKADTTASLTYCTFISV